MNKWLVRLIALIAFVICIALIVTGWIRQRQNIA